MFTGNRFTVIGQFKVVQGLSADVLSIIKS